MDPKLAHLTDPATPIAVIGLGYVGLPLAVEFGKQRPVIGFDISQARVAELQAGHDSTRETTPRGPRRRQPAPLHQRPRRPARLSYLHRHR